MLTKGIENRPSLRKSVHPLILTPGASLVTQTMPLQAVMPLAEAWVRYSIPYSITHHLAMVHHPLQLIERSEVSDQVD